MATIGPSTMTSRHGLANVGNTCYLNSAVQALCKSKPFTEYFGTEAWRKHRHEDRKGYSLAAQTADLVTALNAPGDQLIVPSSFVKAFIEFAHEVNEDIRFGVQADAAEAIQILLDGLHTQQARGVIMQIIHAPEPALCKPDETELVRSLESWTAFFNKEYSPLVDAFYAQTQTKIVCSECKASSTRYEPWSILKAPIPGAETQGAEAPSLQACIASAFASETVDDYTCDGCKKKGQVMIHHTISRFPKHIILSLKRFTNQGRKVHARITYDQEKINFTEWRSWASQGSPVYRVISTIEHLGNSRGGHYIMRHRDPTDNSWHIIDDSSLSVSQIGGAAGPDTYVLVLEQVSC